MAQRPAELRRLRVARAWGVSGRRFLGWEPSERHDHYDADGTHTGYTIVTREPEWDDDQRADAEGLFTYEAEVCPGCHLHPSVADDVDNHFTFPTRECPVCKGLTVYGRMLSEVDEKQEKGMAAQAGGPDKIPAKMPRLSDGRHIGLRIMSPDEVAAHQASKTTET